MNNKASDALGYFQAAAGAIDASTLLSAVGAIPAGTSTVLIQPEAQNVRYRDDGTAPTAAVGMLLVANTVYEFTVAQVPRMRVIAATAGAILNISYYGSKTVS